MIRIIRLAGRDQLMFIVRNMDTRTLASILRNIDAEKMARVIHVLAEEQFLAYDSQQGKQFKQQESPANTNPQELCEPDKKIEPGIATDNNQPLAAEEESPVEIDRSISVIIHPSNPIKELSTRQLKQLFSGDVTNWNQLGGPDLPLKMVTAHSRLGVSMHPGHFIRTPFYSLVVVGVAGTLGAVGLIRTQNERQRSFLNNHSAVKTLGIKTASGLSH
jgi:phosphate transport system substrate-binding protein